MLFVFSGSELRGKRGPNRLWFSYPSAATDAGGTTPSWGGRRLRGRDGEGGGRASFAFVESGLTGKRERDRLWSSLRR